MEIKKVGVLGCGVMGGQIAAHLNNVGLEVVAFDLDKETAEKGMEATKKLRPSPYYNVKTADSIKTASFDDMELIKDCDWVVEAIAEKIEWSWTVFLYVDYRLSSILEENHLDPLKKKRRATSHPPDGRTPPGAMITLPEKRITASSPSALLDLDSHRRSIGERKRIMRPGSAGLVTSFGERSATNHHFLRKPSRTFVIATPITP